METGGKGKRERVRKGLVERRGEEGINQRKLLRKITTMMMIIIMQQKIAKKKVPRKKVMIIRMGLHIKVDQRLKRSNQRRVRKVILRKRGNLADPDPDPNHLPRRKGEMTRAVTNAVAEANRNLQNTTNVLQVERKMTLREKKWAVMQIM